MSKPEMIGAGYDLCWKCWEYYKGHGLLNPNIHCHHEQGYREKCWCEKIDNQKVESIIDAVPVRINFCPECGKSLR